DATIITRFEQFADVFIPDDTSVLALVREVPGVRWVEVDRGGIVPPIPRPTPEEKKPRAFPEKIVQGGLDGLTGEGVVVAIVDTGIDFHHPDFIEYDAEGQPTSRILAYWDTTSGMHANGVGAKAPVKYPNGASVGTVFSRNDLTRELRSNSPRIAVRDANGHGTACAGIAAGNGRADEKYTGVAPKADIVAVRIASDLAGGGMDFAFMMGAACEWMDKIAGERPLVVSCSWGGQYGGRDGHLITERQLDARFSLDKAGRALLFAAGNEGHMPIHAEMSFHSGDDPDRLVWYAPDGGQVELYVDASDTEDLQIGPLGDTSIEYDSHINPLTKQLVVTVYVGAGKGGLYVSSNSSETYQADAYISGQYGYPAEFHPELSSPSKMVGAPGTTTNAITVGSYDWNERFRQHGVVKLLPDFRDEPLHIGSLSAYSSPGPRRMDGQTKPEIVAPGQWYTAPAPMNIPTMRDSTGFYCVFNGTSAATPYTAGIVALMLERKPTLTLGEIKQLLETNASSDARTGGVPNGAWGHGKLDLKAVKNLLDAVE
ncbi:MAG: S8 family serine peptidase, partial [Pirellulaceae bacterium]